MRTLDPALDPETAFATLRRPGMASLFFDGRGGHDGAWPCRLAFGARETLRLRPTPAKRPGAIDALDEILARRRTAGGPGGTGVAVLCPVDRRRTLRWSASSRQSHRPFLGEKGTCRVRQIASEFFDI